MSSMTRRRACLALFLMAGCSEPLPSVPPIPKDYKPAVPPSTGIAPRPKAPPARAKRAPNESNQS